MQRKLLDICKFYAGTGFPVKYQGKAQDKLPFYKVGDIANNVIAGNVYLKMCNNYISEDEASEIKATIIPPNTIVFAKIGEALRLNRRAITSVRCLVDNNVIGIAPKESEVRVKYFYYFMCNLKMESLAESTTVPSVRKSKLEEVVIDLPDLQEQQDIEKKLDAVNMLILLSRKQLKQYDSLIKSRFAEMFGNTPDEDMVTMADVCKIITDGTHQPPQFTQAGIPFLFVSNIAANEICYDTEKYITEETYVELVKRTPIEIGDILLSTVGSYGHPAVVKSDRKFCFQRHIAYLKLDKDVINSEYLHDAILSYDVQRQIDERVKGIAQKTLNLSEIRKLRLPLPPIIQQQQFAAFVEQTDKLKFAVQKRLNETQLLFDSLMQKYFG